MSTVHPPSSASNTEQAPQQIVVAASFTVGNIEEVLRFWLRELHLPAEVCVAPYGQLFQQLFDPGSLLREGRSGLKAVLVRPEDWLGPRGDDQCLLERTTRDCVSGLEQAVQASLVPHLVVACPPSPRCEQSTAVREAEARIGDACGRLRVPFVRSAAIVEDYLLDDWHDEYLLKQAHIPYNRPAQAAIGTVVARHFASLNRQPCKVVAVDCDNTLWGGVCGEDGPDGVVIDAPRRLLQERLRQLHEEGALICLCSKNEERDVLETFRRRRAEMALSMEQVSARRINWRPKSENLRDLARQFNVGLDAVVMLDDSAIECGEVAAACPSVTLLRVPDDPAHIPRFLSHCWVFDRPSVVTAEDRRRGAMLAAEGMRDAERSRASSLAEFIDSLNLEVDIAPLAADAFARIAQLSLRTNQFNLSGRRRQEKEIAAAVASGSIDGFTVKVRDRFGDYGLVGVALYAATEEALVIDSLLLSCRALGRGVEHRMLAEIGRIAQTRDRADILLPLVPTERNTPVRAFVEQVAERVEGATPGGELWRVSAEAAAGTVWQPEAEATRPGHPGEPTPTESIASSAASVDASVFDRIASSYTTGEAIAAAMERSSAPQVPAARAASPAARADLTPLQRDVLDVFRQGFRTSGIQMDTDFFEAGGHSLLAAELMARVVARFGVDLPLHVLFETPTASGIAAAIARARQDSEAPLADAARPPLTGDVDRLHEPFPLTPLQTAYWVGRSSWLGLGNVGTHNYVEIDYRELDLERYEGAWQATIARHPMMRAIIDKDGRQRVLDAVPRYGIAVTDLRALSPAQAERSLSAVRAEMEQQVLSMESWPTFEIRATLLPDGRTRIHTSFDGLMLDLWSTRLVAREVAERYADPAREFPPLPVSFRDFVLSERAHRATPVFERAKRYWDERLATLPPAPDLPLAREPRTIERPHFSRLSASLDAQTWARLASRARRARLTRSGVLLAVFAEVLDRWSKSPRFTINLTLFHRPPVHPLINELVGDFTSLVMLEVDQAATPADTAGGTDNAGVVAGAVGFAGRARRLQDQLWRDLDHRAFTGVEVLREVARSRGLEAASMPVVFTSALALDLPNHDGSVEGLRGDVAHARTQTPQVWLDHQVFEYDGRLEFNWDYVRELFPAGMVEGMFESYCAALQRLADQEEAWLEPAGPVELPAPMRATRAAYNATAAPVPEGLLHEGFERQAESHPERVAVLTEDQALTYGELLGRARHIGHGLRALGVRPNTLVAVAARKGIEQVVGVLGVLMSGAAYLPVDADLPPDRIRHLLTHGEARIVLSQSWLALDVPAGVSVINVDREIPRAMPARLDPVQQASDLAYVIYTSGSTGLPKGVMISHRAALNTIVDINDRFAVSADDRVLAVSSLSFDLSVWDIFGLLSAGGAIVMPSPGAGPSPGHWADLVANHHVTIWNSVPALMGLLVEHVSANSESDVATRDIGHRTSDLGPRTPALGPLRLVMMSGDWIPLALPGQIRAAVPNGRQVSLGGATEGAIWSILYPIETLDPSWTSVPYGRPMRNQHFYVFDHLLRERPDHVPGQLYIGGVGVAEGYWHDKQRTRERFVKQPQTGERMYWTGDLGRRMDDATIEFLGREDFQVKIQGYRIELGEIEAALAQHPAVRAAVVNAVGEQKAAKRLVAYLVAQEGQGVDVAAVRAHAEQRLPKYMVPSTFAILDALPLSANGKVDRKALPAVSDGTSQEAGSHTGPASGDALEQELLAVWREALELPALGLDDDFFAVGGHSLVAVRICSMIERSLGTRLPIASIFDTPTVKLQAALLRSRGVAVKAPDRALVPLKREGHRPPLFFVHGISGAVPTDLARYMTAEQPLYGLQAIGLDGSASPLTSIPEMARRYVQEIREVQPHGPYYLSGYSMGGAIALEMSRQLLQAGESVALLVAVGSNMHENAATTSLSDRARRALQLALRDEHLAGGTSERAARRWTRRLRVLRKRLRHLAGDPTASVGSVADRDLLEEALTVPGSAMWPPECKRVAAHNLQAAIAYCARRVPVRVVLIREEWKLPLTLEDADWGWKAVAGGGLAVHRLPYRYDAFLVEPHVRDVAAILCQSIARAQGEIEPLRGTTGNRAAATSSPTAAFGVPPAEPTRARAAAERQTARA